MPFPAAICGQAPTQYGKKLYFKVKNDILMSVNQQLLVLLDLRAAFDTIHHDKLIQRLESDCGITGNALAWFRSYLSDRFQVSVNGGLSKRFALCQGVPQ